MNAVREGKEGNSVEAGGEERREEAEQNDDEEEYGGCGGVE